VKFKNGVALSHAVSVFEKICKTNFIGVIFLKNKLYQWEVLI